MHTFELFIENYLKKKILPWAKNPKKISALRGVEVGATLCALFLAVCCARLTKKLILMKRWTGTFVIYNHHFGCHFGWASAVWNGNHSKMWLCMY